MPGLILLDPSFPPSSIPPTHKRQRLRLLTTYPIPLTVGGHQSEARSRSARSLVGCFPRQSVRRSLSVFLFAIFIRYFCFGKNKTVGRWGGGGANAIISPFVVLFAQLSEEGRTGLEWRGEGKSRLFCHFQNSRPIP